MLAFHLDLKCAHYRADYLQSLCRRLASAGYTHVIIEIEDKVRLDTTQGAQWCEAYTKAEFQDLLSGIRAAGLIPIPLIQTLGHMESILSHQRYHALRESAASDYMLCPSKPASIRFLKRYMDEVGELFDDPPFMHIGADEAWLLGSCPACRRRIEPPGSKSALFRAHIEPLSEHALSRGWRPIAWADMVLRHSEDIDRFSRDIVWMDWDYWTQAGESKKFRNWTEGKTGGLDVFPETFFHTEIGRHARDANGRMRPWFYADYLMAKGFDVIIAPAVRCGGDTVFAPHVDHAGNVLSATLRLQHDPRPLGMLVTSWALRLNVIETQWPAILIPGLADARPATDWPALQSLLTAQAFGHPSPEFFHAWEALSPCFVLAESWRAIETSIHYYGQHDSIPYLLSELLDAEGRTHNRALRETLPPRHAEARRILEALAAQVPEPNLPLQCWIFAARALQARAEEQALFFDALDGRRDRNRAATLLLRLEALQDEYRALLQQLYTPASVERELGMIFGMPWRELMRLSH